MYLSEAGKISQQYLKTPLPYLIIAISGSIQIKEQHEKINLLNE